MTTCERCDEYIATARPRLLRHVGRWVQRSGKPPATIVEALQGHYHRRGHRA